jgi:hypothetical protein
MSHCHRPLLERSVRPANEQHSNRRIHERLNGSDLQWLRGAENALKPDTNVASN